MPALTKPAINAQSPERSAQELLHEWLSSYFTGAAHLSAAGDVIFPLVDLYFNQAAVPVDAPRPMLHLQLVTGETRTRPFRGSDLGTWSTTLANPASGVSYGATLDGVVESVHGKRRRLLPGTDIRWRQSGPDLLEETLQGFTWTLIRTIPGATILRWVRAGQDYVEQSLATSNASPVELRRFTPIDQVVTGTLWDGAIQTSTTELTILWWARVLQQGGGPSAEFLSRSIGANVQALLQDNIALAPLHAKGMINWRLTHAPRNVPAVGLQVYALSTMCDIRSFVPIQSV